MLPDKIYSNEQINLVEEDDIITDDDSKVVTIMNNFFGNVVKLLNISDNYDIINTTDEISGSIEKAILKYNNHPSIININEKNKEKLNKNDFRIRHTSIKNVSDLILNIDVNKASPMEGIPAKILKANYDLISPILCNDFNKGVDNNAFPDCLKCAYIV